MSTTPVPCIDQPLPFESLFQSGFETTPTGTPDPQYQGQRFLDKVGIDITKAPSKREIPDSDGETTPPGTPTPRAPTPKAEKDDKSNDMRKKVLNTIIYSYFMADIPFGLEVTVTERGGRELF